MRAPEYKPHNDPSRPGHMATQQIRFGERDRYGVFAIHTRFDDVEWIVVDYENVDPVYQLPDIIRQGNSALEVMEGLC